ncbi:hypothetical protein LCGC14_2445110 [marine sediment metagenome]|uniref:Uncharacterized protein n=1 Tax=marine sediment metagenome TaxID=412755 RepID=A0A0F9EBP2_9ZZZZ
MSEIDWSSDIRRRREEARRKASLDRGDLPFCSYLQDQAGLPLLVKRAAAQDLKECRWSREQVAEGLSKLIGRQISLAQIDAMIAETKTHRLPAELIPAWVRITGSARILDLVCAECGLWLADETEHDLAELSRAELDREKAAGKADELRKRLAGEA